MDNLRYTLGPIPLAADADSVLRYVAQELEKVRSIIDLLVQGQHEILYVAPTKPIETMIVYADGTQWNPGSGKGFYYWDGAAWIFIA